MAGISFDIRGDNKDLIAKLQQSQQAVQQTSSAIAQSGDGIEAYFKKASMAVAGVFTVQKAVEFGKQILAVREEIESLEISFETLLGSKDKAEALFGQIRKFAVETPMQLKDLASAAQMMLSFNIDESKIMTYLKALGDVSMGDTQKFQSLSLAFSQMSSAGKLMGQDLMQMINAGFNPLSQMAQETGKSISELKDEMSAGKITSEMVQQAFVNATSEGGKYYNMLEKQSKGLKGSLSNLQGAIDDMFNDIGEKSQGIFSSVVGVATDVVKNYKEVGEAIMAAAASYGTYATAVAISNAIDAQRASSLAAARSAEAASYMQKLESIGAVTAAEQTQFQTELQAAIAKGQLTQAEAEQIAVLQASALARVEANKEEAIARANAMAAASAQAKAELDESIVAERNAAVKVQQAEAIVTATNMRYEAAIASADATAIETAEIELGIAQSNLEAATKEHNAALSQVQAASITAETAAREASSAATAANTATTEADTVAKELNTVAINTDAAATGFLTTMTNALKTAVAKLYATMSAHPYAIVLAAVVALGYAIYKVATYESEHEKAAKAAAEAANKSRGEYQKERAELDKLSEKLASAKKGTDAWQTAKDEVVAKYGQYFSGLDNEITKVGNLSTAYKKLQLNIRKAAAARAMDEYSKENTPDYDKYLTEFQDRLGFLDDKGDDKARLMSMAYNYITNVSDDFSKEMWSTLKGLGLTSILQRGASASAEYQNNLAKIGNRFGFNRTQSDAIATGDDSAFVDTETDKKIKNLGTEYRKAQKAWEDAQAELKKIEDDRDKYTDAQYKAAKANVDATEKAYKELGGDTTGKGTKAAAAAAKALQKEQTEEEKRVERRQELARELIELQRNNVADEIALMKDGVKKKVREIENEYQTERETIAKEAEKLAKANKEADVKASDILTIGGTSYEGLTSEQVTALERSLELAQKAASKKTQEAYQEEAKTLREKLTDGLAVIEDFEKERTAIIARETKRREEIQKNAKLTDTEKQDLTKRSYYTQAQDLAAVSNKEFFASEDYSKIFSNLARLSTKTLSSIKARLQDVIKTSKELKPEELKAFQEQIDKITTEEESRNPIKSVVEGLKKLIAARKELGEAQVKYAEAQAQWTAQQPTLEAEAVQATNEKTAAEKEYNDLVASGSADVGKLAVAWQKMSIATNKAQKATEKLSKAHKQVEDATEGVSNASNDVTEAQDEWRTNMKKVAEACGAAADALQKVTDLLGIADDSTFGEIINGAVKGLQTMQSVLTVILTIAVAIESSMWWLLVIGAAVGILANIGSIFNASKIKKANEEIERQQDILDNLEYTYKRLQSAADELFGTDYITNYNQQLANLESQATAYRKQIAAEQSKGKSADEDKIKDYEESLRDVLDEISDMQKELASKFTGTDRSSAAEQFVESWLEAKATFASTKDAILSDYKDLIKNMIIQGAAAKIIDQILQPMWDNLNTMLAKNDIYGAVDYLVGAMDTFYTQADDGMNILWTALEARGYDMKSLISDADSELTGMSRTYGSASEEAIDALTAQTATENFYVSSIPTISENVAAIRSLLQGGNSVEITGISSADLLKMQTEYLSNLPAISANTAETAQQCANMVSECHSIVTQIKKVIKPKGSNPADRVYMAY